MIGWSGLESPPDDDGPFEDEGAYADDSDHDDDPTAAERRYEAAQLGLG